MLTFLKSKARQSLSARKIDYKSKIIHTGSTLTACLEYFLKGKAANWLAGFINSIQSVVRTLLLARELMEK
jgi:hypothetical protein